MSRVGEQAVYWYGYRKGYYDALRGVLKDNGGNMKKTPILKRLLLGDVSKEQLKKIAALMNGNIK